MSQWQKVPSTAARKSKVKSQKSKVKSQKPKDLYSGLLRHLEWYVYLRHVVLAFLTLTPHSVSGLC
jgi:hypothetical protein